MADRAIRTPQAVTLPPDWKQQLAHAADRDTYDALFRVVESWTTGIERRVWSADSSEPDDVAFLYDAYGLTIVRLSDGWHPAEEDCGSLPANRRRCVGIPWRDLQFPVSNQRGGQDG